ncbi:MAG: cysteine--tRNA ligase [Clostridiales bacterium]|nr:cysteine--tRNA ligase [Clostridiales bacterium]
MKIFNTMTRKKEDFIPVKDGKASIYVCGSTVYDFIHIGNARPMVVFDTLRRYLAYRGYDVTYVQNFTDIDDKMIRRANESGITVKELGDRFINEFYTDAKGLGILPASVNPRATEHINEIIDLVKNLEDKGHAYNVDGDVYFDTESFPGYGRLCGQNLDDLNLGARIDVNSVKKNPMDFALWKSKKEGEPYWESPWGQGRPGWHIECSAMSMKYLGETFDIHAGGLDLIFPHHENEIAQSECCTGHKFAKYWMHNGYIQVNGEKMSKSLGNFVTVRQVSQKYDLEVLRMFILQVQYRNPINYTDDAIAGTKNALDRLYNAKLMLEQLINAKSGDNSELNPDWKAKLDAYRDTFNSKMDDDLNTADAISTIFDLVKDINVNVNSDSTAADAKYALDMLVELTGVLGLLTRRNDNTALDAEVEELIAQRQAARKSKNWAEADRIRDLLKDMGIVIEDTREGIRWKRV